MRFEGNQLNLIIKLIFNNNQNCMMCNNEGPDYLK